MGCNSNGYPQHICLYKEVDKTYTGCNLKIVELLDSVLKGICANMVFSLKNLKKINKYFKMSSAAVVIGTLRVKQASVYCIWLSACSGKKLC